jgi:hypothetical protein
MNDWEPLTWEEFFSLPEEERAALRRQCGGQPWGAPTPDPKRTRDGAQVNKRRIVHDVVDGESIDNLDKAS